MQEATSSCLHNKHSLTRTQTRTHAEEQANMQDGVSVVTHTLVQAASVPGERRCEREH